MRAGQLEGYRVLLTGSGVAETRLILLTRYPQTYGGDAARHDHEVRWFEVADWFESELPAAVVAGELPAFLVQQFLDFLEARGMTLTQVGKFMPEGLRALSSLMNMLTEAASACEVTATSSTGSDYFGLRLDKSKYWIGVNFSDPENLWFGTRCKIDPAAAEALGVGELDEESWIPGRARWWRNLDLESEPVHFFSRSKVSQMECLEGFLRICLEQARSIQTADQPPIPNEPGEGSE